MLDRFEGWPTSDLKTGGRSG